MDVTKRVVAKDNSEVWSLNGKRIKLPLTAMVRKNKNKFGVKVKGSIWDIMALGCHLENSPCNLLVEIARKGGSRLQTRSSEIRSGLGKQYGDYQIINVYVKPEENIWEYR